MSHPGVAASRYWFGGRPIGLRMAAGRGEATPWVFGAAIVALWVVGWVGLQTLLFDGNAFAAAVQGAAGGAAFAVVFLYLRRRETA